MGRDRREVRFPRTTNADAGLEVVRATRQLFVKDGSVAKSKTDCEGITNK
jgi:hypothetical protein